MRIDELSWNEIRGWSRHNANVVRNGNGSAHKTDLVLYFGIREALANGSRYLELRTMFPDAHIVGCSTGGQIRNDDVSDDEISAATLSFDATGIRLACEQANAPERSRKCGEAIGKTLAADDLAGIFVLSDGLNVNGSELVAGMTGVVGERVPVTGGLAGDGALFITTAEGVENQQQLEQIRALGCTEMQGYLFSRPCRAEDLLKLFPSHYEKRALSA